MKKLKVLVYLMTMCLFVSGLSPLALSYGGGGGGGTSINAPQISLTLPSNPSALQSNTATIECKATDSNRINEGFDLNHSWNGNTGPYYMTVNGESVDATLRSGQEGTTYPNVIYFSYTPSVSNPLSNGENIVVCGAINRSLRSRAETFKFNVSDEASEEDDEDEDEDDADDDEDDEEDDEDQVEKRFNDIDGHWAENLINEAADKGYIEGYSDGSFRPNANINRAEASKIVALFFTTMLNCTSNPYIDVLCAEWYGKYIAYLTQEGILHGYGDGYFRPGNPVTRAEALKILLYSANLQNTNIEGFINPFSDLNSYAWYYDLVLIGNKLGYIEGYADGTFKPDQPITRAEFIKLFVYILLR